MTEKTPEAKAPVNKNAAADLARKKAGAMVAGANSTMLTGPGGVDPAALSLGKNTLLGG